MGEIRLGPIEWGVVTTHHLWGMGVRLEESGDDGVIVLDSVHDDFLRCNGEYWPEIGERIRVRRYLYGAPDDEVRLDSGQIGQLRARLMESGPDPAPEERWPGIGERVRIRPLGFWPDGSLRLSGRPSFVDQMPRRYRWLGRRPPSK